MATFKKIKFLPVPFILILYFFLSPVLSVHGEILTDRLGGMNRYETAVKISQKGWTSTSDKAILATGEDFPDALSAAPLAKKMNAPILLTQKDRIPSVVLDELLRLKVKSVYIIGGTGVITPTVEKQLQEANINVNRVFGSDRYETAIEIAKLIGINSGEIVITNGHQFTEALSISPIAAQKGIPIILVDKDTCPESVKSFLNEKSVTKSYILGGTDLINDSVASKFKNVDRIDGLDPYERNINILKKFEKDINFSEVCIATGKDYPDALAGSVLASLTASPILLVDNSLLSESTKAYSKPKLSSIQIFRVFGLSGAVKDDIIELLKSNGSGGNLEIIEIK